MIAVGIERKSSGSGYGSGSGIPYLQLAISTKGTNNCIPNVSEELEPGDVVFGWKDANTYWVAAIYLGGDPIDRANYQPLNEIEMETSCTIYNTIQTNPHYSAAHYSSAHYST